MRYLEKSLLGLAVIGLFLPIAQQLALVINHDFTVDLMAHFFVYFRIQPNEIGFVTDVIPTSAITVGYFGYYILNRWRMGLNRGETMDTILSNGVKPFTGSIWGDACVMIGVFIASVFGFWFFVLR